MNDYLVHQQSTYDLYEYLESSRRIMNDYPEQLATLEKANPKHPLLWAFRRGYSAGNALLLQREIEKLPPPVAPAPVEADGDDPNDQDDPEDETLRRLRMEQSNLFSERRKLSNTFHDCANDRQRATVSEKIQVLQHRIESVKQTIRTYKEQGRIPEPDEKYPVPDDPFKLLALRDSLRASISRKKREIEHIGREIEEKDPAAPAKLEKAEAKLKDLQIHLKHVQKGVTDRNLQPGGLQ